VTDGRATTEFNELTQQSFGALSSARSPINPSEQLSQGEPERLRKSLDDHQARVSGTTFDVAQIRSVNARLLSERLLV
jgi:hypothetical protein